MSRRIDITGIRFGAWTVLHHLQGHHWKCRCDCGKTSAVASVLLRHGKTKSCGCQMAATIAAKRTTHGMTRKPEYNTWSSMVARCTDPKHNRYGLYGGRGIKVCEEWRYDFAAFYAYIGPKPSKHHSIDRIDVNGDYEKGNVRWATPLEQAANKRNITYITYKGQDMTLREFSVAVGIRYGLVLNRRFAGWDTERIANTPAKLPKRKLTDDQIKEILASPLPMRQLAKTYGVSESLIHKMHSGGDGYKAFHKENGCNR